MNSRISPKTRPRNSAGIPAAVGGKLVRRRRDPRAPLRHGPRIKEQELDVEEQKDNRHQIVPNVKPLSSVADRVHARFVRHLLHFGRFLRSEPGAAR